MRGFTWIVLVTLFLAIAVWYYLPKAQEESQIETARSSMALTITSPAFEMNGAIPEIFTCDGKNISPELVFNGIPPTAKSLALTMEDPDVPKSIRADGMWNHWIVWNIPPTTTGIREGAMPEGVSGTGTSGNTTYAGPCPPDREHRYFFTLYALDSQLSLQHGSSKEKLLQSLAPHIIEKAVLIGTYNRN